MSRAPSPSIFSQFYGTDKFFIKPYDYDRRNSYQTERIYITPKKRDVIRYVNGVLLRIVKKEHHLGVYRPMISSSRMMRIGVCIRRYDKKNTTTDPDIFRNFEFDHHDECSRWRGINLYDSVIIRMVWPENFCYAKVDIMIMKIDTMDTKATILKGIGEKKNGFAYLDVIGGSIRVYKQILSNQIDYFNKLFNGKKKRRYKLDVDIEDMIEIIYCLSPFNRPIRSGLTYGAPYRLSDKFKCWKLADMAANYINRIRRYAPCLASYIAYEGNVVKTMEMLGVTRDPDIVAKIQYEEEIRRIERDEWLATGKEYEHDEHRSIEGIIRRL